MKAWEFKLKNEKENKKRKNRIKNFTDNWEWSKYFENNNEKATPK